VFWVISVYFNIRNTLPKSGTFLLGHSVSFLTSSSQRVFGLPIGLLEMGFQEYIAFTILVPRILSM